MNVKKSILITNGHLNSGGVERSLVNVLRNFDFEKFDVDLLLFEGLGDYYRYIPSEVNVINFDLSPYYGSYIVSIKNSISNKDYKGIFLKIILMLSAKIDIRFYKLLKFLRITKRRYDVGIAYRTGLSLDYISYCIKSKTKYMWWHHGEYNLKESKNLNKSLKNINKIVCVSKSTKKMISPFLKSDKCIIPNMLDVTNVLNNSIKFNPYKQDNTKILVSVGRLSEEKHMINCVLTMDKLLHRGYTNIKWYLVGDGLERNNIEEEINSRNLQENVILVGNQENPYPYIKYANFYVHTSYVESQGLSVLEAMALGKCGVVTKSLGVEEFIVHGENALLAEQSVDDLVKNIELLLNDSTLLNKLTQNQLSTIKQFSPEIVMKDIYKLLEE